MGPPQIATSNGTTKIVLESAVDYSNLQRRPEPKRDKDHDPDSTSFGVVYVSEVGRPAMASASGSFPVGSIIVREKLPRVDAAPELLAVMVKRERGFNPKSGDWEFLVMDGSGSAVKERQKSGSCQECHASQKSADFVFRTTGK